MLRKCAIAAFLSWKFMITRSSIAFEDLLASSIAQQVMPTCQPPTTKLINLHFDLWGQKFWHYVVNFPVFNSYCQQYPIFICNISLLFAIFYLYFVFVLASIKFKALTISSEGEKVLENFWGKNLIRWGWAAGAEIQFWNTILCACII